MSDPLRASRLPELPNAGYRTKAERELSDAMMFLIRGLERNRLLLLEVVIGGPRVWRQRFKAAYKAIQADDTFADAVFGYLVLLAGPNPAAQKARLELALRQQQTQSWDKRIRTLMAQSKDTRALLEAIQRDEAKAAAKPVSVQLRSVH